MKNINQNCRFPIYRLQLVKDREASYRNVARPLDVIRQMKKLAYSDREEMVCLFLDARNKIIGEQVISIGTLNTSLVHPREVFKLAILANAGGIILAHNHPSGEARPSESDTELTRKIAQAGRLLGIELLDHVIIAPGGKHYSYAEEQPATISGQGLAAYY